MHGHEGDVSSASFSADGAHVATASSDKSARLWHAAGGQQIAVLRGHTDAVNSVAFSPDGKCIATASDDRTARLWDANDAREIGTLQGHGFWVRSAAFSPEGTRIVTASADRSARIWDTSTLRETLALHGHEDSVNSAAFSPDGSRIVTASRDKSVRVWDAISGRQIAELNGHRHAVGSAAFSPDGSLIVSTGQSRFGATVLWHAASTRLLAVLQGRDERVWPNDATFSPDGERVVTACTDNSAKLWDVRGVEALAGEVAEVIASCLTHGRGIQTRAERQDLLMQTIDENDGDLHQALLTRLTTEDPAAAARVHDRAEFLDRRLDPDRYRAPSRRTEIASARTEPEPSTLSKIRNWWR